MVSPVAATAKACVCANQRSLREHRPQRRFCALRRCEQPRDNSGRGNGDIGGDDGDAAGQIDPAGRAGDAGRGGRDQLHRPRDPGGRQSADPRRSRIVDRGHGLSAVRVPVGLCVRAIADRRDGRQAGAAHAADAAASASGRSRSCSAGWCRASASSSAPASCSGVGEAPQFPTGARVVRDWFNPRDRGLATGIFNCASSLGTAIAVPLLTFLMLSFGWRAMFVIMGVAGPRRGGGLVSWSIATRRGRADAGGERLSDARRSAGPAHQGHLARVEAAVPLPHHLGHDLRLFRLHLSDLDLHRVAARLSRDRAAHEREVHRMGRGHSLRLRRRRRRARRLSSPTSWCAAASSRSGAGAIRPRSRCSERRPARWPRPMSAATRWRSPSSRSRCFWSM